MKSIVYVVDALRADHLSVYGYERETSPRLTEFADNAYLFSTAYSQSTWTRASAGVLLSGAYPPTTGLTQMTDPLPPDLTTFPGRLLDSVTTACISSMGNVSSTFGFDRCFDEFVDLYRDPEVLRRRGMASDAKLFHRVGESEPVANPTSFDINDVLLPWIDRHRDEDFFVLVWSIDPHDPYEPMDRFRTYSAEQDVQETVGYSSLTGSSSRDDARWIEDRYDDLITQNDAAIGELVDHLRDLEIFDETCLVVTGDHGEAFGEHGVFGHATVPYEEVVHVPLLFKLPSDVEGSGTIDGIVEHVDVAPTILDLYEADRGPVVQGQSLLPAMRGSNDLTDKSAFSHTNLRATAATYVSLRDDGWKYIDVDPPGLADVLQARTKPRGLRSWFIHWRQFGFTGREDLYRVTDGVVDEETSFAAEESSATEDMRRTVTEILASCDSLRAQTEDQQIVEADIDDATREQLEGMGYL